MKFIQKHKLVLLHISFWVVFVFYRLFDLSQYLSFEKAAVFVSVPLLFDITVCYLHYFIILPILINQKNTWRYTLLLIIMLSLFTVLRLKAGTLFLQPLSPNPTYYGTVSFARVVSIVWSFLTFLVFTGMIKFTVDWFSLETKSRQLENEKLNSELNYLKAQVNPHFLFNTLHNLNYLALQKKDEASDVIIKLSNIMRYMIYDANRSTVSIDKEVTYMKDYIELERIRLNRAFTINFDVEESSKEVKIAPLLLITFIENAFKHGVSDKVPGCWIKVELAYVNGMLNYKVSNSRLTNNVHLERSGFGLANLKRRLELHYPDNHMLKTSSDEDSYTIQLSIDLN